MATNSNSHSSQASANLVIIPVSQFSLHDGRPMIDWALEKCWARKIPALVVTLANQTKLLDHLEQWRLRDLPIEIELVEAGTDAEMVLAAENAWAEKNLVLLPALRFAPLEAIEAAFLALDFGADVVLGNYRSRAGTKEPGIYGFRREVGRKFIEFGRSEKVGNISLDYFEDLSKDWPSRLSVEGRSEDGCSPHLH